MDRVEVLQSDFGHAFYFLPYLILGFTFLYGLLTSNIGLLWLFLGQGVLAPIISTLASEGKPPAPTPPAPDWRWMSGVKDIIYLILLGIPLGLGLSGRAKDSEASIISIVLSSITGLVVLAGLGMKWGGSGAVLNPFRTESDPPSKVCSVYPGFSNSWAIHIMFFFGYIFANVYALYTAPVPLVDPSQKNEIETRVGNRKTIAATAAAIRLAALVLLLFFRFRMTECEKTDSFTIAFVLPFSCFLGISFFNFVSNHCGVRPVDVLGIVQGMVTVMPPTACMADVSQATDITPLEEITSVNVGVGIIQINQDCGNVGKDNGKCCNDRELVNTLCYKKCPAGMKRNAFVPSICEKS